MGEGEGGEEDGLAPSLWGGQTLLQATPFVSSQEDPRWTRPDSEFNFRDRVNERIVRDSGQMGRLGMVGVDFQRREQ
jgi:hypothetical protein